jgi:CBS domain containing-hemolysin-like protein
MSPAVFAVLVFLILANALYVAAEFGAVGVRRNRVRRMAEDKHPLARRLLPYVEDPVQLDRYVGVSQVGITLSSLVLGAYAQATLTLPFAGLLAGWFPIATPTAITTAAIVVLVTLTATQLVVSELVPKAIALQFPTQTALATVLPMLASLWLFRPFIWVLNGTAIVVLRWAGVGAQGHRHLHSPEEIDLLIAESRDGGLLEPDEQQRLQRALRLGLRRARDLMVPRERLTMVPEDAGWDDLVRTVASSPFSRIPVYRASTDQIIGTLRVKDLVDRFIQEGPVPLERLMRPITQVAPDLPADRVIGLMRERRAHQAVVTGPDGSLAGLITIEDLLDELLGLQSKAARS